MTYDGKYVGDVEFVFKDNAVYRDVVIEEDGYGGYTSEGTMIIDKDTFVECYKRWIVSEVEV